MRSLLSLFFPHLFVRRTRKFAFASYCFLLMQIPIANADGQERAVLAWARVYDGPANSVDIPNAFLFDKNKNFYVTGRSVGINSAPDFATIKYDSSGQQLLTLRYDSPLHSWDEAYAIALDDTGNIFVAGMSNLNNMGTEIVLIKYAPSGSTLWERHYPTDSMTYGEPRALLADDQGRVIVGGTINGQFSIDVFSSDGTLLHSLFLGQDSTSHTLSSMAIDNNGNIYVAGSRSRWIGGEFPEVNLAIAKIDSGGTFQWVRYLEAEPARRIKIDHEGNAVVVSHGDGTTAKYSSEGNLLWYRNCTNSQPCIFLITDFAIDSNNRIAVGGYDGGLGWFDYAVIVYDEFGNVVWKRQYNSPDSLRDFGSAVALDRNDNIYITGSSNRDYQSSRCSTVKYDPLGNLIWEEAYSTLPGPLFDGGNFIVVDDSGSVYVGGTSTRTNGLDYLVFKLRQEGTVDINTIEEAPESFRLHQNYPNPFNPTTTIKYQIPRQTDGGQATTNFVTLKVYDLLGREVRTLVNEVKTAGEHSVTFDATGLTSGVYFYRLQAGELISSRKLMLVK